jgi:hypothetical protein
MSLQPGCLHTAAVQWLIQSLNMSSRTGYRFNAQEGPKASSNNSPNLSIDAGDRSLSICIGS